MHDAAMLAESSFLRDLNMYAFSLTIINNVNIIEYEVILASLA